jgi:hypothetical protein
LPLPTSPLGRLEALFAHASISVDVGSATHQGCIMWCGHKSAVCRNSPSNSSTATNVQGSFTTRTNLVTHLVTVARDRQSTHKRWQVRAQQVHYLLVCLTGNFYITLVLHVADTYCINIIKHRQAFLPHAVSEDIGFGLYSQRRVFESLQANHLAHCSRQRVVTSMLQVARNTCNSCWYLPALIKPKARCLHS